MVAQTAPSICINGNLMAQYAQIFCKIAKWMVHFARTSCLYCEISVQTAPFVRLLVILLAKFAQTPCCLCRRVFLFAFSILTTCSNVLILAKLPSFAISYPSFLSIIVIFFVKLFLLSYFLSNLAGLMIYKYLLCF